MKSILVKIDKIKHVALGDGSYGTKEYITYRHEIIKNIESKIVVFIAADYLDTKFFNKIGNINKQEFTKIVKKSNLYDFQKCKEWIDLFWYCHTNKIPIIGYNSQKFNKPPTNDLEKKLKKYCDQIEELNKNIDYTAVFDYNIDGMKEYKEEAERNMKKIHKINDIRNNKIGKTIRAFYTKKYPQHKFIYLLHNTHIHKDNFDFTLALWSKSGSVRLRDPQTGKSYIRKFRFTNNKKYYIFDQSYEHKMTINHYHLVVDIPNTSAISC